MRCTAPCLSRLAVPFLCVLTLVVGPLGRAADCNQNGVEDTEEIDSGGASDCNENGVPDSCDIGNQESEDIDLNGVPDECEDPSPFFHVTFDAPDRVSVSSASPVFSGLLRLAKTITPTMAQATTPAITALCIILLLVAFTMIRRGARSVLRHRGARSASPQSV